MITLKKDNSCYIVAELSANHGSKLEIALETVRAAAECGADAIKLQTYKGSTITLDSKREDFLIEGTLWEGKYLYDLYEEAHLPWEWHKAIFEEARKVGIDCFSSPFDRSAVDFLEDLNCPIYKIASLEITDIPLIEYVASKNKPIIISTGVAGLEDIKLAIEACRSQGNEKIVLLKCTSSYPTPVEEVNISMIPDMASTFNVLTGLSDHTLGVEVPIAAAVMGAKVIEKHFILDKSVGGPDASFSLEKKDFIQMVKSIRLAEKAIGKVDYSISKSQKEVRRYSRSLYITKDVLKGELFTNENLKSIRPGYGYPPRFLKDILGKRATSDISSGSPLKKDDFF